MNSIRSISRRLVNPNIRFLHNSKLPSIVKGEGPIERKYISSESPKKFDYNNKKSKKINKSYVILITTMTLSLSGIAINNQRRYENGGIVFPPDIFI